MRETEASDPKAIISNYEKYLAQEQNSIRLDLFNFNGFGREHIKRLGIPASDFMVSAIAVASYLYYGRAVGLREPYPLKEFRHGRLDNRRTLNIFLLRLAKSFSPTAKVSLGKKLLLLTKGLSELGK